MKNSQPKEHWESHVDKLIFAVWQGNDNQAGKTLSRLQTALKQQKTQQNIDETLLQALDRLAAFYCLERRFDECEKLFLAVQSTQLVAQAEHGHMRPRPLALDKRFGIVRLLREACKPDAVERSSMRNKLDNGW